MELKCAILVLTSLCVVFIAIEEIFQLGLTTPTFISNDKVRHVASKPASGLLEEQNGDEKMKKTHQSVISLLNGDYYYDDGDANRAQFADRDVSTRSYIHNDKGAGRNIKISRQESGGVKRQEETTEIPKITTKNERSRPFLEMDAAKEPVMGDLAREYRKMRGRVDNHQSEEERLSLSPYIYHEETEVERLKVPFVETGIKSIAYFLSLESSRNAHYSFRHCRYKKCAIVANISDADLVVFTASSIRDHNILTFYRPPGQRWLMHTIDPSIKKGFNFHAASVKSLFNATMTYNLDADIPYIFGRLRKVIARQTSYYGPIFDRKTKLAAWFVSHCVTKSKRALYVKRMLAVMDVDIYGKCGNLSCGGGHLMRSKDGSICLPMLTREYKFYLAFENSYCMDYVTEKFFKVFQDVQVIPVVRGGFDYKRYLPSGTYVNADDFDTPEDLARYLVDLGNDKQRYIEMLRRKDEWRLLKTAPRACLLCEYLHSNPPNKFYPNLKDKFGRGSCWYPSRLEKVKKK